MRRRAFVLACLALSACATAPRPPPPVAQPTPPPQGRPAPSTGPLGELEPVYRAQAGRDALTISVASNGCTTKGDFAFYLERKGSTLTLSFGRKRIDPCKSFAMGKTDLTFTWAELGVSPRDPVFLLNPLVAWTGPGT
jgi:hypothetical protein